MAITPSSLPNGTVNTAYNQNLTTYLSAFGITFYSGSLPPGILLGSTIDGVAPLSGTPTLAGTYTFTLQSDLDTVLFQQTFTIVISAPSATRGTSYGGQLPPVIHFVSFKTGCPREINQYGVWWTLSEIRDGICYYKRKTNF